MEFDEIDLLGLNREELEKMQLVLNLKQIDLNLKKLDEDLRLARERHEHEMEKIRRESDKLRMEWLLAPFIAGATVMGAFVAALKLLGVL